MPFVRKNVWDLGGDWADPILWYARGVAAMKARPLAEPTGWRFYGAIHGFSAPFWTSLGYLGPSDTMPAQALITRFWRQCQHGSWYFLPWHRGYVLAFEANVRAAIVAGGGPSDWALPYWNYFKPGQTKLPPAFASPDWPDGTGDNPLFVKQRYGPQNDGDVFIPPNTINLDAMADPDFTGVASGGSPGFGGVDTGFSHGGRPHGRIESQPHDLVHVLVGGGDQQDPGLMSSPASAGLDPIFWLHHGNIDRLWQVWIENPTTHADPTDPKWRDGPGSVGERMFSMPMPDGSALDYTPGEMADLATLGYTYDDLAPAPGAPAPGQRLRTLGASAAVVDAMEGTAVAKGDTVELVGANGGALPISGGDVRTSVRLDAGLRGKVTRSLATAAESAATAAPDRVFLDLENVRGLSDGTALQVYVGLPEGANPADHPDRLAGAVGLFGVSEATDPDGDHAGQGLTFVLEITGIVDAMHLDRAFDVDALDVRIVPLRPVPEAAGISIGRISIFRQGR